MLTSKVVCILTALNAYVVGARVHGKRRAPALIRALALVADGKARYIQAQIVADGRANTASVVGGCLACDGHVTACNRRLELPVGIEGHVRVGHILGSLGILGSARLRVIPAKEDVVGSGSRGQSADGGAVGYGLGGSGCASRTGIKEQRITVDRPLRVKRNVDSRHSIAPYDRVGQGGVIIPAREGVALHGGCLRLNHSGTLGECGGGDGASAVALIGNDIVSLGKRRNGYVHGVDHVTLHRRNGRRNGGNIRRLVDREDSVHNVALDGGQNASLVGLGDGIDLNTYKLIGNGSAVIDVLGVVGVRICQELCGEGALNRARGIGKRCNTLSILGLDAVEGGVQVLLFGSRSIQRREVEGLAVSCAEGHILGASVGVLHVLYGDLILSCGHIEVVCRIKEHALITIGIDDLSTVGGGVAGVAGITEIARARIFHQLQNLLGGGKGEDLALKVTLRPNGAVALGLVTHLNGGGTVLGKLLGGEVGPYQRDGDCHIVLGPAKLIQTPHKTKLAGQIVNVFGYVYADLIIHEIFLSVALLIYGNEGEVRVRKGISKVDLIGVLCHRESVAAPEIVSVIGDPGHNGGVGLALYQIQHIHRTVVLGKVGEDTVGGIAVLILDDQLLARLKLGSEAVNIALVSCREQYPLAGVYLPFLLKKGQKLCFYVDICVNTEFEVKSTYHGLFFFPFDTARRTGLGIGIFEVTVHIDKGACLCGDSYVTDLGGNDTHLELDQNTGSETQMSHCVELESKALIDQIDLLGATSVTENAEPVDVALTDLVLKICAQRNIDVGTNNEVSFNGDLEDLEGIVGLEELDLTKLKPAVILFAKHICVALGKLDDSRIVVLVVHQMCLGEEGLNDVILTVLGQAFLGLLLADLTVCDQLVNKVSLCLPEALDILAEAVLAERVLVLLLEGLNLVHRFLAKVGTPVFLQLIEEVLVRLLGVELSLDGYRSIAHHVNGGGEDDIVDLGNADDPRNVSGSVDADLKRYLLREGGGKLDLQASHLAVLADIHLKLGLDLKGHLDTLVKVAVLAVTGGNVEAELDIIGQLKGITKTVGTNLLFGELDAVFVVYRDLVNLNVIVKFVAGGNHVAQILHRFLGEARFHNLLHHLLLKGATVDVFQHLLAVNVIRKEHIDGAHQLLLGGSNVGDGGSVYRGDALINNGIPLLQRTEATLVEYKEVAYLDGFGRTCAVHRVKRGRIHIAGVNRSVAFGKSQHGKRNGGGQRDQLLHIGVVALHTHTAEEDGIVFNRLDNNVCGGIVGVVVIDVISFGGKGGDVNTKGAANHKGCGAVVIKLTADHVGAIVKHACRKNLTDGVFIIAVEDIGHIVGILEVDNILVHHEVIHFLLVDEEGRLADAHFHIGKLIAVVYQGHCIGGTRLVATLGGYRPAILSCGSEGENGGYRTVGTAENYRVFGNGIACDALDGEGNVLVLVTKRKGSRRILRRGRHLLVFRIDRNVSENGIRIEELIRQLGIGIPSHEDRALFLGLGKGHRAAQHQGDGIDGRSAVGVYGNGYRLTEGHAFVTLYGLDEIQQVVQINLAVLVNVCGRRVDGGRPVVGKISCQYVHVDGIDGTVVVDVSIGHRCGPCARRVTVVFCKYGYCHALHQHDEYQHKCENRACYTIRLFVCFHSSLPFLYASVSVCLSHIRRHAFDFFRCGKRCKAPLPVCFSPRPPYIPAFGNPKTCRNNSPRCCIALPMDPARNTGTDRVRIPAGVPLHHTAFRPIKTPPLRIILPIS